MATREQLDGALQRLAANRDDPEAWEHLFAASWATALSAANRILRGQLDLARDAAQEAFRRIVRYCDFRDIRDANVFLAYLAAVSRNTAYNVLRQLAPQAPETSVEEVNTFMRRQGQQPTPEQLISAEQLRQNLFAQLNPDEQALLELLLEGYSLEEMASKLGLSYGAAGVRLHRLRTLLRKHLIHKGL